MNINNGSKTFNIKNVLKESYALYIDNFKMLMKISVLIFGVNLLFLCESSFNKIGMAEGWEFPIAKFSFLLTFVYLFFHTKFSIVLILYISKRYKNIEITIEESFIEAKEVVWKNFRAQLRIFLKTLLPLFLLLFYCWRVPQNYMDWFLVILGLILLLWILTKYSLVPVIRTLEPYQKKYFKYARILIKKEFWKVLVLTVLVNLPLYNVIIYRDIIVGYENVSVLHNFIVSSLNYILLAFVYPYFYAVYVIVYYKLSKKQK